MPTTAKCRAPRTLLGGFGLALLVSCSGTLDEAGDAESVRDRAGTEGEEVAVPNAPGDDDTSQDPADWSSGVGDDDVGSSAGDDTAAPSDGHAADPDSDDDGDALDLDDPGFKGLHRLSNREYDNTVADLLGTQLTPAAGLLNETAHGFDNIAASLGMTSAQYNSYFRAAADVSSDVFQASLSSPAVHSCATEDGNAECVDAFVEEFGERALRRPLIADEVTTFRGVYDRARELDEDHLGGVREVVRSMLASAEFLYRMEFDPDPDSAEVHDLLPYELASRLSYFLWSSMPDDALLSAARDGSLRSKLDAEVDRMLAHKKAGALVDSFAWQWLGLEGLESHAVLSDSYPDWNEELRGSMLEEARLYLSEFVLDGADWRDFLTADVQFVDERLAAHYEQPLPNAAGFVRRADEADERLGFLGLSSFLTLSSFAHRTSPTLRAKWILESLMCTPPPPPPAGLDIPDLDTEDLANLAASLDNVKERLELHRSDPSCAGCHNLLDPLGLALENFDGIGRFRTHYEDGQAVEPQGELASGESLEGLPSLARVLGDDKQFYTCTTKKLLTYALGRGLTSADADHVTALSSRWQAGDGTLLTLARDVIRSVPFQRRRGAAPSGEEN